MSDSVVKDVIRRARAVADRPAEGWTKSRLAREAGLSHNALCNLFEDDFNPTAETLEKIEQVLLREGFAPGYQPAAACAA